MPVEEIDTALPPGALTFLARTRDAYVYENPRALPRAMLVTGWRVADFAALVRDGGWPDVDPDPHGAAGSAHRRLPSQDGSGTARIVRYTNTEVVVEVEAPASGFLVLNDVWHPWWRASVDGSAGRDPQGQRAVPRGRGAAGPAHRAVHVPSVRRGGAGDCGEVRGR